jgi:multicomponent Na+:H+ antiporter subunit D
MQLIVDHIVILPILIPLTGGILGLLLRSKPDLRAQGSLAVMVAALISAAYLLHSVYQSGQPVVFQVGGWAAPFGITLVADLLSAVFVLMSHLVLVMGLIYALGSKDQCVGYPTFFSLFLFLATGLTGALLTGDIFNLFVFVELLALSSTVLTSIADDRFGTEAAYKYFFMSQLAAFFLLLSVGAMYVSCGTLNMAHLAMLIADEPKAALLPAAAALLMVTFLIKSATFPFHFWQPDFHTAAPTPVSAMLSSVVVKLGVYGFIRMTTLLFVDYADLMQTLLMGLGVTGILYGGLAAIGTHNVKRMFAYSTLAQVGFILVAIGWGTTAGLMAAIVFAFNHSIAKSAMLMLAGYVASRASIKSAAFDVVTGVGRPLPLAGVLFFVGSLGLAGIPPTNGFISKMLFFKSGLETLHLWPLLLVGLASALTLIYSMRAFMRIWWLTPAEGIKTRPTGDHLTAPAMLVVVIILLGLFAEPLVELSVQAASWLEMPEIYIHSVLGG